MKKIVSFVLLLAMCLSLFAGCTQPAETPAASNLDNAKARLFNMYKPASKDEVPAKSNDFEVVTGILVDGVSYAVDWTVTVTKGAADAVKIVDGSSASYKKVDLTEKPEENVEFTLTATIKDGDKTATVSFSYITPAVAAPSADKIVLGYPEANSYITGAHYLYTSSSGSQKYEMVLSENKAEAIALTVVDNGDDTVSFVADGGYYLFCDATHVKFVTEQSDNTKFVLEPANAEGGYFIKCAIANYNGKAQYLEVYSGYLTCYGMGSNTAIYTFTMDKAENAAGTISGLDTAPADPTDPPATETPTTQTPTTNPPATEAPSNPSTPAITLTNGSKVVIYNPAFGKALSTLPASEGSYYQKGVDVTVSNGVVSGYADTEVFTVIVNADGSYSFAQGGKNLGLQDSYSSMGMGYVNDDWTLEPVDGGLVMVKNVVRGNCIEWYNEKGNWSTYNKNFDNQYYMAIYVLPN